MSGSHESGIAIDSSRAMAKLIASRRARRSPCPTHDDGAEEHGEQEQPRHGDGVHALDTQNPDADPRDDEHADHEAPDPAPSVHDAARRERTVIDHDARPADELQNVQRGKEHPAA